MRDSSREMWSSGCTFWKALLAPSSSQPLVQPRALLRAGVFHCATHELHTERRLLPSLGTPLGRGPRMDFQKEL